MITKSNKLTPEKYKEF